jgi:hypothetical protein
MIKPAFLILPELNSVFNCSSDSLFQTGENIRLQQIPDPAVYCQTVVPDSGNVQSSGYFLCLQNAGSTQKQNPETGWK